MSTLALNGLLALLPASATAGAWTQEQGATLMIVKTLHSSGRRWFDDAHHRGKFDNGGRSRQDQFNVYVEHGLSARLSAIGNFYFTEAGFESRGASGKREVSTTGFADQEIGLRYALRAAPDSAWLSSVQALVSLPAYGKGQTYDPTPAPGASSDPALGLGDKAVELRYSRGRGYTFGGRNAYVDLGGALRLRNSIASDEVRLDATAGLNLTTSWQVLGEVNAIHGLGNGRDNAAQAGYVATGTNYDLVKLQLSAIYTAPGGSQWQLGYQQPLMGRNTGAAGSLYAATWWRF